MYLKTMEVSFWRHKSKKAGYAKLYCRIHVGGEAKDIASTGIRIRWDDWDGHYVSSRDPEAAFKNDQLDAMRGQLRAIFNDLYRAKEEITAGKIKRIFTKGSASITMLSAFDLYLQAVKEDPDLTDETWEVYDNVRKKLIDFLAGQKALDLQVEEFDLTWLIKYRTWMKRIPVGKKIGHADSYVRKHTQTIMAVCRWAKLHHLADVNSLDGFRVPGVDYDDPVFLTEEEFERLRKHRFSNEAMQEVADIFIIYCRTGFHFSDLKDFVRQHEDSLRKGLDGEYWLMKDRVKTQVKTRVPQFAEVAEIVEKYGGWEKLPIKANAVMNRWLKLIAAELGLPADLSTKAGRKTFTDWCFNTLGLSTESVKVMLGRKSDKGLEVYGRPDERRVIQELNRTKKAN